MPLHAVATHITVHTFIEDAEQNRRFCFGVAGSEVSGIRAVLSAVVQNESSGVLGLMRGWLPSYLRIGPLFLGRCARHVEIGFAVVTTYCFKTRLWRWVDGGFVLPLNVKCSLGFVVLHWGRAPHLN